MFQLVEISVQLHYELNLKIVIIKTQLTEIQIVRIKSVEPNEHIFEILLISHQHKHRLVIF